MLIFYQLLAMVLMIGSTYVLFRAFGPPRSNLLYSATEKHQWDALIAKRLGSWFAITNVAGTLTSFATVYLFFVGNSKLFGWWIFLCCVTIWGGAFVTNYFTKAILKDPHLRNLLDAPDQRGGVIASVLWRPEKRSRQTAALVKWLSLVNIGGVIWLEFALFADISGKLLNVPHFAWNVALLGFCCIAVCYFTLRYGLRGFVFADSFQVPLIVLAAVVLLIGTGVLLVRGSEGPVSTSDLFTPILPLKACLLFAFHVLFLNLFLVLVTESHWLRLWIFKKKETTLQVRATSATAVIWGALIVVGLLTSAVSTGAVGESAVVGLISQLAAMSPVFPVAFWIGGMAALFSTADAQIYSFALVSGFDTKSGNLNDRRVSGTRPLVGSIVVAIVFCTLYAIVRLAGLPFEKIVFLVIPLSMNVLPSMVLAARNRAQQPSLILLSLALYAACAVIGFVQGTEELAWTLAAALMPVSVAVLALLASRWLATAGGHRESAH